MVCKRLLAIVGKNMRNPVQQTISKIATEGPRLQVVCLIDVLIRSFVSGVSFNPSRDRQTSKKKKKSANPKPRPFHQMTNRAVLRSQVAHGKALLRKLVSQCYVRRTPYYYTK